MAAARAPGAKGINASSAKVACDPHRNATWLTQKLRVDMVRMRSVFGARTLADGTVRERCSAWAADLMAWVQMNCGRANVPTVLPIFPKCGGP